MRRFPDLKSDVIGISTVVMGIQNTQVKFHNSTSRISCILKIPVCIFSYGNLYNVQFMRIISFLRVFKSNRLFFYEFLDRIKPGEGQGVVNRIISVDTISIQRIIFAKWKLCSPWILEKLEKLKKIIGFLNLSSFSNTKGEQKFHFFKK